MIKSFNEKLSHIVINLYHSGMLESGFWDSLSFDIILYITGMAFVFIYAFFIIGKCGPVLCRFSLTIAMIISYLFSVLMALGIMGYAGITLISGNVAISFFLALETILYCSYLVKSIDNITIQPDEVINYPRKFAFVYKSAGVSLFKTFLITVTSFSIGTISRFPAIASFCTASSLATVFLYFNCMTLFTASLYYDFIRVLKNQKDCCGQCYCAPEHPLFCAGFCVLNLSDDQKIGICDLFMQTRIVKFLLKKSTVYAVLIMYLTVIAIGIAGILKVNQEIRIDWLVNTHSSQIKSALDVKDEYFGDRGYVLGVYVLEADFSSEISQQKMLDLSINLKTCDGCHKD